MDILNINVGLLGHVDSGKTSLAKCLSTISSTACYDKNPQSQERGITIDLGFSSFSTYLPQKFKDINSSWTKLQFTLVDCPGHASLIRTVIGGVQIIDLIILVVDITKGIQTQTAECLIIGEIMKKPMIVVLNKIDLLENSKRDAHIAKVSKKMMLTLANSFFKESPIVAISANSGSSESHTTGVNGLINKLVEVAQVPERSLDKPMILCVDHCFSIKGKGTVLTGTVIQGKIKLNQDIEIPQLKLTKKVKSLQMFHQSVTEGSQGDRMGVCVTQFDPKLLERGIACEPGQTTSLHAAIVSISPVKYYKSAITNKTKYHITIGYETVLGKLTMFTGGSCLFDPEAEYLYKDTLETDEFRDPILALMELETPVLVWEKSFLIGSKLDVDVHTTTCRIAFSGHLVYTMNDKSYATLHLPNLKIFKYKEKHGVVQRIINENELIAESIFKKETNMNPFVNLKVTLSTGETGIIESTFGSSRKVKIRIPDGLKESTQAICKKKGKTNQNDCSKEIVSVILKFKKYIFDKDKKIFQD